MELSTGVLELSDKSFAPYGRVLSLPDGPPGRRGDGWECWYGFFEMDCPRPLVFGAVTTSPRQIVVSEMERHVLTPELLYPHDHELVQPVGPPGGLEDDDASPSAAEVRAFLIPVGAAVLLHQGTWHSPAFPLRRATSYGFACWKYPGEYVPEWRPFPGGQTVRVHA